MPAPRARPSRKLLPRHPVPDDNPDAGQRFDVFFTHEQMIALNDVSALMYEQWGVRVNKSQLLRALIAALDDSREVLRKQVQSMPTSPLPNAPAKAADAEVHRRFELKLRDLLARAMLGGSR